MPMKKTLVTGVLSILALGAAAHADTRPSSPVTTQTRAVPAFKRLELRGPIDVTVREGAALHVAVTIDDALQKDLVTRVDGDELVVDLVSHGNVQISSQAKVAIEVPSLVAIRIEGPGNVAVQGSGAHPRLDVAIDGPGDLRWSGDADVVACKLEGPGDAILRGSAKRLDVDLDGPGDLDGRDFAVVGGSFDVSGPGHVRADLHGGDVSVTVSGPGGFRYTGDAHFTRREVSGPGYIRKN
jgi:hypothetical protein